jgi:hypothetical protein
MLNMVFVGWRGSCQLRMKHTKRIVVSSFAGSDVWLEASTGFRTRELSLVAAVVEAFVCPEGVPCMVMIAVVRQRLLHRVDGGSRATFVSPGFDSVACPVQRRLSLGLSTVMTVKQASFGDV